MSVLETRLKGDPGKIAESENFSEAGNDTRAPIDLEMSAYPQTFPAARAHNLSEAVSPLAVTPADAKIIEDNPGIQGLLQKMFTKIEHLEEQVATNIQNQETLLSVSAASPASPSVTSSSPETAWICQPKGDYQSMNLEIFITSFALLATLTSYFLCAFEIAPWDIIFWIMALCLYFIHFVHVFVVGLVRRYRINADDFYQYKCCWSFQVYSKRIRKLHAIHSYISTYCPPAIIFIVIFTKEKLTMLDLLLFCGLPILLLMAIHNAVYPFVQCPGKIPIKDPNEDPNKDATTSTNGDSGLGPNKDATTPTNGDSGWGPNTYATNGDLMISYCTTLGKCLCSTVAQNANQDGEHNDIESGCCCCFKGF